MTKLKSRRTRKTFYKVALFDEWNPLTPIEEKDRVTDKFHQIWTGLLERALSEKFKNKCPTYKDVTVCKEWLRFSNFANWAISEYHEGLEIDKDILSMGPKIYSPYTCCFVPQFINTAACYFRKTRELPIGVTIAKPSKKNPHTRYKAHCKDFQTGVDYIKGFHTDVQSAHRDWQMGKVKSLRDMIASYSRDKSYRKDIAEVFLDFALKIEDDIRHGLETKATFFSQEELKARGTLKLQT